MLVRYQREPEALFGRMKEYCIAVPLAFLGDLNSIEVLYCTVLHCTARYCTVLHGTVLCCAGCAVPSLVFGVHCLFSLPNYCVYIDILVLCFSLHAGTL